MTGGNSGPNPWSICLVAWCPRPAIEQTPQTIQTFVPLWKQTILGSGRPRRLGPPRPGRPDYPKSSIAGPSQNHVLKALLTKPHETSPTKFVELGIGRSRGALHRGPSPGPGGGPRAPNSIENLRSSPPPSPPQPPPPTPIAAASASCTACNLLATLSRWGRPLPARTLRLCQYILAASRYTSYRSAYEIKLQFVIPILGHFPGRSWTWDPLQRVRLEKWSRTHPQSAP